MVGEVAVLRVGLQCGHGQVGAGLVQGHVEAACGHVNGAACGRHLHAHDALAARNRADHVLPVGRLAGGFAVGVGQRRAGLGHAQHLQPEQPQALHGVTGACRQPVATRAGPRLDGTQGEGGVPVHTDGAVCTGFGVQKIELALRGGCSSFHHHLVTAGLRTHIALHKRAHLLQVGRPLGRAAQRTGDGGHLSVHAALDVHAPQAYAARLHQQAHRVLEAIHVAPGVGLGASHRDALVVRVGGGGVVPVAGQVLALECRHHGLVVPLFRRLGQKLGVVGRGGVLQQRVVALDGVELLQVAADGGVFMGVQHQDGPVGADGLGQRAGLGRVQQQVVAVHVHAVRGDAGSGGGAVRVGTGHDHDVDAVQQGLEQALHQLAADDQQGLAAGGFVAMLLANEHHRGPAAGVQVSRFGAGCARGEQAQDGLAPLRHAQVEQPGPCAARAGRGL